MMKFFFFFTLLVNIVFFLWEMNTAALNLKSDPELFDPEAEKQILLLSELPKIEKQIMLIVDRNKPIIALEGEDNPDTSLIATLQFDEQLITEQVRLSELDDLEIESDAKSIDTDGLPVIVEKTDSSTVSKLVTQDSSQQISRDVDKDIKNTSSKLQPIDVELTPELKVTEKKGLLFEEPIDKGKISHGDSRNTLSQSKERYCYQIGPFNNKAELNAWQKSNKLESSSLHVFNKESQIISGYLVHYPAVDDFSESKNNVKLLRSKGITDLWLFRKGELKGIISLGLFVEEKRALHLKNKLVKKGLAVEIMQRYKTETSLFVDMPNQEETFKDTLVVSDTQGISKECGINNYSLPL